MVASHPAALGTVSIARWPRSISCKLPVLPESAAFVAAGRQPLLRGGSPEQHSKVDGRGARRFLRGCPAAGVGWRLSSARLHGRLAEAMERSPGRSRSEFVDRDLRAQACGIKTFRAGAPRFLRAAPGEAGPASPATRAMLPGSGSAPRCGRRAAGFTAIAIFFPGVGPGSAGPAGFGESMDAARADRRGPLERARAVHGFTWCSPSAYLLDCLPDALGLHARTGEWNRGSRLMLRRRTSIASRLASRDAFSRLHRARIIGWIEGAWGNWAARPVANFVAIGAGCPRPAGLTDTTTRRGERGPPRWDKTHHGRPTRPRDARRIADGA
jgi:hypothetical protein